MHRAGLLLLIVGFAWALHLSLYSFNRSQRIVLHLIEQKLPQHAEVPRQEVIDALQMLATGDSNRHLSVIGPMLMMAIGGCILAFTAGASREKTQAEQAAP